MDPETARSIAYYSHHDRRDRLGELRIEHVARVVAAVPAPARTTAWLHEALEHSETTSSVLREGGMSELEEEALDLLTRGEGEPFELHMLRIAHARGPAGDVARAIKIAELDDDVARSAQDPLRWEQAPYAWARRHLAAARERSWTPL